jgi:NitT/TauT family transport system substrate-binding protein
MHGTEALIRSEMAVPAAKLGPMMKERDHMAGTPTRSMVHRAIRPMAVLALAVAAFVTPAKAESVVLGQATNTSLTFGPVFAGIELGFFKDESIELQILDFQGASVLLPQIANKAVTIGFPGPDPLILSRQPGRDSIPAKFFYNAARQSIWEFLVREDSPLKTLTDLRGKTIGVGALANANVPITRAMLKELGMVPTKDYSFMAIGVGAPAFRATINKDVDTYNTFDTNIAAFEVTGAKLRRLPQDQKYLDLFSNGFVAHDDTIKNRPQLLIGFGRAFTKGILVCDANPTWCVKNFYKHNPNLKPAGADEAEVIAKGEHILASRMKSYLAFPAEQPRRFGEYSEASWKNFVGALYEGGEMSSKDIDVSTLFTNQFVPQFNDFDANKVIDLARSLK